jgi:hypothetical protein
MSDAFVPLARGFYLEGLLVDGDDIWFTDEIAGGVPLIQTLPSASSAMPSQSGLSASRRGSPSEPSASIGKARVAAKLSLKNKVE